jgi:hypothetical protein
MVRARSVPYLGLGLCGPLARCTAGSRSPGPNVARFGKGRMHAYAEEVAFPRSRVECMAPWMWMCGCARVGGGVLCRMYEHVKC